jgi:transposase
MAFIRKIKKGDAIYLAKVESYREAGKVKQRVLEYVGKEENGIAIQKVDINKIEVENVKHYTDVTVLYQLSQELKLPELLGKHNKSILALLIAHLLCKGSIVKINRWIDNSTIKETLRLPTLTLEMLYSALDYLEEMDFDTIEQSIHAYWQKIAPEDQDSMVVDVTDTYYHGKHDETAPRRGKDGKISKLIQIGLGVSFENGFPIFHKTYSGNIGNIKILGDLMRIMASRGIISIIMDRGFYSEANVDTLHKLKMKMIIGIRKSVNIRRSVLNKINRDKIYTAQHQIKLKDTYVYVQQRNYLFGKIIVIYNPKYEAMKRDKMLAEAATDEEVKYVGYSLIFHNTNYSPEQVVKKYFDKDIIERSFRTMKGDVQLHPVRLWMPTRVNAHIKICYLSLCLLSLIKFRCGHIDITPVDIIQELQAAYRINLRHIKTNQTFSKIVTLSNLQKNILRALKCSV